MQNIKNIVRRKSILMRDSIPAEDRKEKSRVIIESLSFQEAFTKAGVIMCYVSFRSEVETHELIKESLRMGKRVTVPVVIDNTRMCACEISNMNNELDKGIMGILEPKREIMKIVEPSEIDFIIAPGTAFDMQMHRMGYGKGYYDRFLSGARMDCIKAGVCFDVQIYESIPFDKHDMLMDMIITEKRIIKTG